MKRKSLKMRKYVSRYVFITLILVLAGSIFIGTRAPYHANAQQPHMGVINHAPTNPRTVLGIDGDLGRSTAGIPWVRLSYRTCGDTNLAGKVLKSSVQLYHRLGIRVILSFCQQSLKQGLFNTKLLNDAAQSRPDAVQCGNEQMKHTAATLYVTPQNFARFFDLCQHIMLSINPGIPVMLGSLDPHVGGIDYQPLVDQVQYLDAMQTAMNKSVHPGSHWSWRSQVVGLIDSWHNGYPDQSVNSLYHLLVFWSQEFHVDLNKGELGKHLWVIEGTGCIRGCGINANSAYVVAVSHILTLITDVQTARKYGIPFFYFSGKDFVLHRVLWSMGIFDLQGHPKPLRQDLRMGARRLTMSCSPGRTVVSSQVQLLIMLYRGCSLPRNYVAILSS